MATGLFADVVTDVAKDAAMSKAKSEARTTVIKQVAGDDATKKAIANKVVGKEDPVDKMKANILGSVMGSKTSVPDAGSLVDSATKGATKETSLEDKALDMAAEKVVGSNPLKKEAAKAVAKEALK